MQYEETNKNTKVKSKKKRRSKARGIVVTICILIIIAAIFAVLCKTVLFPVQSIVVSGNTSYGAEEIVNAAGLGKGEKLYGVSERAVSKILTEKLPYIKSIKLKRQNFNTLIIVVTNATETFCYTVGNAFYIADADNKILAEVSEKPQNLTEIITAEKINLTVGKTAVLPNGKSNLVGKITSELSGAELKADYIDVSLASSVTVKINNRFIVDLGSDVYLEGKMKHLKGIIESINEKSGDGVTGKINLSVWTPDNKEGYFEEMKISEKNEK